MADGTYRVKVKEGASKYINGTYSVVDHVGDHVDLSSALLEFFEWVDGGEDKVTLIFKPTKN